MFAKCLIFQSNASQYPKTLNRAGHPPREQPLSPGVIYMTISLERALKYRRQYFMLNALAHVLPTAKSCHAHAQSPTQTQTPSSAPGPSVCYDKLGKFILLCAIRLLAQFPLKTCTGPRLGVCSPCYLHYLHSLQFQFMHWKQLIHT